MLRISLLLSTLIAVAPSPAPAPDYVAAVGPISGAWTIDGSPAIFGEPIVAGASLAQAHPGAAGRIAIYLFDGRLMEKTCPGDPACAGSFGLDPLGDTTSIKAVMQDGTKAMPHYHFVASPPSSHTAADATPVDGIARLGTDGSVDLGEIMQGVPYGPYRLIVRPLDPHSSFAPSGDPIFKLFTWNGEAVSVAVGGIPEGLYSAQLFSRDDAAHALGSPGWVAVIGSRGEAELSGFHRAHAIAATWNDPEAKQLFLRSYLVNAAFPQSAPVSGRHRRAK